MSSHLCSLFLILFCSSFVSRSLQASLKSDGSVEATLLQPLISVITENQVPQTETNAGESYVNMASRVKRNIMLVDEDFDVTRMNQNWKEGEEFKHSKSTTEFEGSGGDQTRDADISSVDSIRTIKDTPQSLRFRDITEPLKEEVEGSGGSSTDGMTRSTTVPIESSCLSTICDEDNQLELEINYELYHVPEGFNLTLSCAASNYTREENLYWYKNNGSVHSMEVSAESPLLNLQIEHTASGHSGIYKCVRWTMIESRCCHKELHLIVYEIPFYNYHLLTVAVVIVVCLLTCFLLNCWRNSKIKKFSEAYVSKSKAEQALLP